MFSFFTSESRTLRHRRDCDEQKAVFHYQGCYSRNVLVSESISEAWVAHVQARVRIKGGLH